MKTIGHPFKTIKNLPEQLENPDWEKVQDYAMEAAAFTMAGDMIKANDLYQAIASEVMNVLYGENAVRTFVLYAIEREKERDKQPKPLILSV